MRAKSPATLLTAFAIFCAACGIACADGLDAIIAPGTQAEELGSGYGFCEGPASDPQGNVYFSDGKKDSIHLYRPGKAVEVFVNDSTDANGMMFNAAGELVVCEGAAYRVVAFDVKTKKKRVLVGGGERQFNEPNDLTIDRAGGFYFTDPNYKHRKQEPIKKEDAYYCAPDGKVTTVSTVCVKPNGIHLSADEKTLYLADCTAKLIYRYDVVAPGKLANETRWLELEGHPDGMTLDERGNIYFACGGKGVQVYSRDGKKIGAIGKENGVPYASNCVFGGPDFKTLYITSAAKFLGIKTKVNGLKPLPLRKGGRQIKLLTTQGADGEIVGWRSFHETPGTKTDDVWRLQPDGTLVCAGTPKGYLYTEKDYVDFTLKFEWRYPKGAGKSNGGVLVRMTGEHCIWPKCLEFQLNMGQAGDFWGLRGYSFSGPAERFKTVEHATFGTLRNIKRLADLEKPIGEWNQHEAVVDGGTVTQTLNGKLVNKATDCEIVAGKILLTAEGQEIHYRNIRLIPKGR